MFTIYEYYDPERIIHLIRDCKGDVYLPMEDGTELNLKQDERALQLLFKTGLGREGLRLRLTNQSDLISFVWLTLQAA